MLRNGRLLHLQSIHNLPHWPFLQRQIVEYLSPPRLRHSIKSIRSRRRTCHGRTIHSYMGICQVLFFMLSFPFLLATSKLSAPLCVLCVSALSFVSLRGNLFAARDITVSGGSNRPSCKTRSQLSF